MLFTLGGFFKSIISLFKTRVLNDGGTFEAETNLENQLNALGSTLFNSASLVITPNGVKTSKLNSIKPNDGTGDLSVVRNTSATRIDENGNIVNVPANVARIDYTTGSPAILVEPQRTNLVYPSDIATTQVRAVTAVAHTLSFYGTGSVTLSGAFSGSLAGTGTNNKVSLTFTPTAGNLTLTVSGSVTNWQLEAGSNATSLIKTISGSVTRNADIISKSGISNLIGQTEGTFFIDFYFKSDNPFKRILEISDGTTGSRFILLADSVGNKISLTITTLGILQSTFDSSVMTNGRYKIALSYVENNVSLFANGTLLYNDNTSLIPLTSSIILGGSITANRELNAGINSIAFWKNKLTDEECINLTTL